MNTSTLNNILMESGLDLFSKINNVSKQTSNISELDCKLLPGLESDSIVEISGASKTGKTILILKYIVKSILPVTYQDLDVGGLALNVLQVDMELKFNIRILVEELEHYLNQCIDENTHIVTTEHPINSSVEHNHTPTSSKANPPQSRADLIASIVQDSLSRFYLVPCYGTSENLALIFQAIESRLLSTQLTLDLVMIENILSYYFEDISTGLVSIGKYVSRLLHQSVLKYIRKFNLALIYTKYIPPGRGRVSTVAGVTHSIQLSPVYRGIHKCVVNTTQVMYYRIEQQEMVWTDFQLGEGEEDEKGEEEKLEL
ncbi:uncharacterized protein LOC103519475 isoform X2 [Diaphorina citri]|uniref:Uncharacterized protein LOC103519475 isoform X1 n=1 Tax=Diaphorina citri TaxID=121845 RepID=A0A1S3DJ33_DIACI|nr:uncharacterized protein LOC103519475 isoform X1 [Diaphorina citri]XP_026686764.1 uncharacterized protein LOC103519475 isoform X2 [Diaphorina citri]